MKLGGNDEKSTFFADVVYMLQPNADSVGLCGHEPKGRA